MKKKLAFNIMTFTVLINAQSYSLCDPLKSGNCAPNPALGGKTFINFAAGASSRFIATASPDSIEYTNDSAEFIIKKSGDNPTLQSKFYIMFGRVEAVIKAAPGIGIVSSFVLQSDDLDEVDVEWIGGDHSKVQTNYFSKGDTSSWTRGEFHPINNPQATFHNYTIDWSIDRIVWYVDNNIVRILENDNWGNKNYPQTPMAVKIGAWAGGDPILNAPGTVQWAGGLTNFKYAPFILAVRRMKIADYSTGSKYSYRDRSGSWNSIQAMGGIVHGIDNDGTNTKRENSNNSNQIVEINEEPKFGIMSVEKTSSPKIAKNNNMKNSAATTSSLPQLQYINPMFGSIDVTTSVSEAFAAVQLPLCILFTTAFVSFLSTVF